MNGFLLFTFTASIAVSCMALALAIASQILHKTDWGVRYIVFQSCLIGIMVMYLASKISLFFMPENLLVVFNFIFKTAMMASMSFVIVYLPFFLSWVIAKPWRKVQLLRFTPLAMTYFGIGLAALIVNNEVFSFWVNLSQTLIFLGMYVYCII
ncbi:MAG: hypothetical protein II962_00550, partial [Spirochaetales bacterium]|nr:hypothetical protein [Spirochaetales bacterium]